MRLLPTLIILLIVPCLTIAQSQDIDIRGNAFDLQVDQRLDATGLTIRQVYDGTEAVSGLKQVIVVFGNANGATFEQTIIVPEGLPLRAATSILKHYGEGAENVEPERIEQILTEKAEEHQALLKRLALLPTDDTEIKRLRDKALTFVEDGDYESAKTLYAEARQRLLEREQERQDDIRRMQEAHTADVKTRAAFWGLEGDTDKLSLNYIAAAEAYLAAADIVAELPDAVQETHHWLMEAQEAYYRDGDEFGRNASLEKAIDLAQRALNLITQNEDPDRWAATQNSLGITLKKLGTRKPRTKSLEEAITAYRRALEERTRDRVPLEWARTQHNLGNALRVFGERETGTERLEQAVVAFQSALEELTRDRVPLDWATTQADLGTTLGILGGREMGTERLEQAVTAFRSALEERTRDRVPLLWASTQHGLGTTLAVLGSRETGTERLEQAVATFQSVLEERTRDRLPLEWARTQHNLGLALQTLGEREQGTERLEQAVAAYRAALKEWTRDRIPVEWAKTQYSLGRTLLKLKQYATASVHLSKAAEFYPYLVLPLLLDAALKSNGDPFIDSRLGDLYFMLDMMVLARLSWERALRNGAGTKLKNELRVKLAKLGEQ